MKARKVFYGSFLSVLIASLAVAAVCGFQPNAIPDWCAYAFFPGWISGFLFWWVFGFSPGASIAGGCLVASLCYALVALAAYGTAGLMRRYKDRCSG